MQPTRKKYLYFQQMNYQQQLQAVRAYFHSVATRSYAFIKGQLQQLKQAVLNHEEELYAALEQDLKKSWEESWVTEIGFLVSEINNSIRNLRDWMTAEPVRTNLLNLPSSSYIMNEPLGVVLIIGPWNYPMQLLFTPLAGAIAAGNCVVLKPSELAPATAAVMKKIIDSTFPKEYILYAEGAGAEVVPMLMNDFRFDHVFYTGSTAVGKLVYKMAAEQLVPVTLELGGKSPCVIEADANLKVAARRIALTKFSNAGQMCVAPDYLVVHEKIKDAFVAELKQCIEQFFTKEAESSYNFGRIINAKQFDRLVNYLQEGKIVHGGRNNKDDLYIEPTIMEEVPVTSSLMKDEVFGPVVPLFTFSDPAEAINLISKNPDPLAFYIFTSHEKKANWWLKNVPAGGACVNNASWHLTNHHLPFGGRGNSGIGRYHGKFSFDTFTHKKAVLKTPTWFDPSIKYPPFKGKLGLFKKLIR